MKKLVLILFPLLLLCGSFFSCSDGSSGDGDSGEEQQEQQQEQQEAQQQEQQEVQLVKSYAYKLNCELPNKETKEKETFHRVQMFNSVDNGDGTYNVKEYEMHYFAKSNSDYSDLEGDNLCEIVIKGTVEHSKKYNKTLSENTTATITTPTTNESKKYLFSAGLEYTVYYYF